MTPAEKLSPVNFLSVCDIVMDILEELQMTTKDIIQIPLLRTIIRPGFNILMPGGDIDSGERYCNLRLKAIEYLRANNYINDLELSDNDFFFNRKVEITVDRKVFDKFYNELAKVYQKRVVDPAKKEMGKSQKENRKKESAPIKEVIEIKGLEKGLEAIATMKKKDSKPKFPYKLPAGSKWQDFIFKFLDDENIYIQVKQFKYNTSYKEMGFVGKGNNPNPSKAWIFMKVLSTLNGELTIKDPESRDKYKKQKELLVESLQNYFSLDYDPFYPYRSSSEKEGNSYKIKIILIPPLTRNKAIKTKENKKDMDFKDFYKEQTPQIYEREYKNENE